MVYLLHDCISFPLKNLAPGIFSRFVGGEGWWFLVALMPNRAFHDQICSFICQLQRLRISSVLSIVSSAVGSFTYTDLRITRNHVCVCGGGGGGSHKGQRPLHRLGGGGGYPRRKKCPKMWDCTELVPDLVWAVRTH